MPVFIGMSSGITQYLANQIFNNLFRGTAYTFPTTLYIGLFTADPSDSTPGTEVSTSGTAYARVAVVCNTTNWGASAAGAIASTAIVAFAAATASQGTVSSFGVFDAVTAGNLLLWGDILSGVTPTTVTIANGNTASFASGALSFTAV